MTDKCFVAVAERANIERGDWITGYQPLALAQDRTDSSSRRLIRAIFYAPNY
jgi:hypothetical protein